MAGLVISCMILGLFLAGLQLISTFSGYDQVRIELSISWVVVSLILLMVYLISAVAWNVQLKVLRRDRRLIDAICDMGFIAVGKYVPGKVLGILARGAKNIAVSDNNAASLYFSAIDQVGLLFTGLYFSLFLFLVSQWNYSAIELVGLSLALFYLCYSSLRLLYFFYSFLGGSKTISLRYAKNYTFFAQVSGLFLIIWILTSFSLYPLLPDYLEDGEKFQIISIFCISIVGGWVAVFVPAGVGVREGLFVIMSGAIIPLDIALTIAAGHRIIAISVDVLFSGACILIMYNQQKKGGSYD
ncbi:hypothetical protein [uncultured Marinobacter sp.]|uniref:hypothetical protein n=1 Tax=uncultured Marinobacter sp. TaxID=187379 RepID=UPI002636A58D|nr:hypothetical protein [uncultured Marinobacter sp.]